MNSLIKREGTCVIPSYLLEINWYVYNYNFLAGNSENAPDKDYSINGSQGNRVLGAFNAISIISTTYGCGIIPEIQVLVYLFALRKLLESLWRLILLANLIITDNLKLTKLGFAGLEFCRYPNQLNGIYFVVL